MEQEADCLKWMIDMVSAVTHVPCCIDSSTPEAMESALAHLEGKQAKPPMVKAISLESARYDHIMPVIRGTNVKVMANIITAEALAGKDSYSMNYLRAFRAGQIP